MFLILGKGQKKPHLHIFPRKAKRRDFADNRRSGEEEGCATSRRKLERTGIQGLNEGNPSLSLIEKKERGPQFLWRRRVSKRPGES